MKNFLIAIVAVGVMMLPVHSVSARASGGGTHFKNNPPYDCSVTKKPSTPKWVVVTKKDKIGDGKITLTWDDSKRAHDVKVKYWYAGGKKKTDDTGDDSREDYKNLKKGKLYHFTVRGYSNCGESGWSKEYRIMP
ncbi:MAG: fibronectin type III domain-containing protein [Candidatus Moraniibacteriota bacterium]